MKKISIIINFFKPLKNSWQKLKSVFYNVWSKNTKIKFWCLWCGNSCRDWCASLMFFIRRIDRRRSLSLSLSISRSVNSRVYTFFGARMIFCRLRQLESFGAALRPVCFHPTKYISASTAAAAVHPPGRGLMITRPDEKLVSSSVRERENGKSEQREFLLLRLGVRAVPPKQRAIQNFPSARRAPPAKSFIWRREILLRRV